MKKRLLALLGFAVGGAMLLVPGSATAVPVPALDLLELSTKADLIVVGRLMTPFDVGTVMLNAGMTTETAARVMTGTLSVERVLKGTAVGTIDIRFVVPQQFIGYGRVVPGTLRVFFLKAQGNQYEFVSPYYPSVVAGATGRIQGATPYERVLEAVAVAIQSSETGMGTKREAIQILIGVKTPPVMAALRQAVREGHPSLRLAAVAGLLAAGDVSVLPLAVNALLEPDEHDSTDIHNLRVTIRDGVRSDAAVPTLGRLLQQAAEPETRRDVAFALAHTRARAALTYLGQALDDPDFEVRLQAARGLADLTGEIAWKPTWDSFKEGEARYLAHWKAWLARRGG